MRRATTADVAAITEMLVRAFDDDPVAAYMFAGYRRRRRGLHSFFSTELGRHYLPNGHVYTTDDLSGAALWGPPDRERHPVQELLELLPTAPYLLSPHVLGALRLMFTVEGLHPKESHWYLFTLGTAPERQGKGVGSALLRSMLSAPRPRKPAGIPRVLQGAQRAPVRPLRLRSHRCAATDVGESDHVANVARTPASRPVGNCSTTNRNCVEVAEGSGSLDYGNAHNGVLRPSHFGGGPSGFEPENLRNRKKRNRRSGVDDEEISATDLFRCPFVPDRLTTVQIPPLSVRSRTDRARSLMILKYRLEADAGRSTTQQVENEPNV